MILFMQPVTQATAGRIGTSIYQWFLTLQCGHTKTMPWRPMPWHLAKPGKYQPRFCKCLQCEKNGLPSS